KLSETVKMITLVGSYVRKKYGGRHYAKGMKPSRPPTAADDAGVAQFDLLFVAPTAMKARPMPGAPAPPAGGGGVAGEGATTTSPFDVTHHPAMSVPCGMVDGLPVGMMLVGKHFDEPTIYRTAYAFEQAGDWKTM